MRIEPQLQMSPDRLKLGGVSLDISSKNGPCLVAKSDSCYRTPGSSLAAAHCNDSCSRTPGSSLAIARLTVSAGCSCSCTPGSSLAMARLTVLADSHSTGFLRLCA